MESNGNNNGGKKDFDVQAAARRLNRLNKEEEQARNERRARAKAFARDLALDLGKADSGLEKVFGFGSTFEEWRNYRLDSDIDLGIIGGNWFFLMSKLPSSEFSISLIELDLQNPEFREHVVTKGELLYEKS